MWELRHDPFQNKDNCALDDIESAISEVKRFAAQGAEPLVTTPAQFGAIIAADVSLWGRIVRETGATVD